MQGVMAVNLAMSYCISSLGNHLGSWQMLECVHMNQLAAKLNVRIWGPSSEAAQAP